MRFLDLKAAARSVGRSTFVSTLAIIAFALGIGVTTAVFSIFNGVLLAPLPYPESDRLVRVYDVQPACATCPASFPKYVDWKTRNHVFAAIGGSSEGSMVLTGAGDPVRVRMSSTTASFGDVLGARPNIGRWYTEDEDRPGGPKVVVLSADFFAQQFGSDRSIVGKSITLNGDSYQVIGVLPPTFAHRRSQIFIPLQRKLDPTTRGNHFLPVYARLKPGVTVDQAAAEMRTLGQTLAREFSNNHGVDVQSMFEATVGNVRTPLRVLLGAVLCVLLIACANVANLLLAAGLARRRELAIRVALGASTSDLARQMAIEGLLLSLVGGTIGVVLAMWMVRTFVGLAGTQLPRATTIGIDARVLGFAALVSIVTGIVSGLWPVVRLRTRELASAVREGDVRTSSGAGRRFGDALVVSEIAMAFALVVGAGLLVKNLVLLRSRDAGIRTERIVAADVSLAGARYRDPAGQLAFYRALEERLSHTAGIESAGMTSHLPMFNYGWNGEMQIEGGTPWGPNEAPLVEYRWIYGDYLKTMGVRLLSGRLIDARDGSNATAVLINESMARKFWPGKDPLGKRFGQGNDTSKWYEVVGVLSDVRSVSLARNAPFEFYRTLDEAPFNSMTVVIRTAAEDPMSIVPTVRQIVASIDPTLPLNNVQTMEHVVDESVGQPRLMSALTTVFGALAGLLAIVGVYGVMAYNVRRQRREFGIRLALGADTGHVRNLVVARGLGLAVTGVAIGFVASLGLTGVLRSMLNDVKPTDSLVFATSAIALIVVATMASYLPARAAARVDPMVTLRDA
ncbi:MAG TPA: ABC transporter permease [Vicinamibacterales bacterium]|nr:ABC transporter permease [Vicinamibacterales bacterium]